MEHPYELQVTWEDDGYRISTAWTNFCYYVREQHTKQRSVDLIDTLSAILSELKIYNPPNDSNIYFETAEDRLMFVLRWS